MYLFEHPFKKSFLPLGCRDCASRHRHLDKVKDLACRSRFADDRTSFKLMEVDARKVDDELHALAELIPAGEKAVWVHFGVGNQAGHFLLEVWTLEI